MFVVVSYDIPDDRRRAKVLKTLKNYGLHVQYSVFECDLKPDTFRQLKEQLAKLVSKTDDNIRFYTLCQDDWKKRRVWGKERGTSQVLPYYMVKESGKTG